MIVVPEYLLVAVSVVTSSMLAFFISRGLGRFSCGNSATSHIVLAFLTLSWMFTAFGGILAGFRPDLSANLPDGACNAIVTLCIALYGSAKFSMYCFLAEKYHLLSPVKKRLEHRLYLVTLALLLPFPVVMAFVMRARVWRNVSGVCYTGVNLRSAYALLCYDLFFSFFQTSLFLYRVLTLRKHSSGPSFAFLSTLARRCLAASIICAVASASNLSSEAHVSGSREARRGTTCLGICMVDIALNAMSIYWTTTTRSAPSSDASKDMGEHWGSDATENHAQPQRTQKQGTWSERSHISHKPTLLLRTPTQDAAPPIRPQSVAAPGQPAVQAIAQIPVNHQGSEFNEGECDDSESEILHCCVVRSLSPAKDATEGKIRYELPQNLNAGRVLALPTFAAH